jgi:outer membrane protein
MKKVKLFAIAAFVLSSIGGSAQNQPQTADNVWSLQECIDYAVRNSIPVNQSLLQVTGNQATYTQALGGFLPSVNAYAVYEVNSGYAIDQATNAFRTATFRNNYLGAEANLSIFRGFQQQNLLRQSKFLVKSSQAALQQARNEAALNVSLAYLQVLNTFELMEVARSQVELSKSQAARTERLVQAGSLPQVDLLTLQGTLANDEALLVDAQSNYDLAKIALMQQMNLPVQPEFQIEKITVNDPNTEPYGQTVPEIYEIALKTQPSVQSADLLVRSRELGVASARGGYVPNLSLRGSLDSRYSSANNDDSWGTQIDNNLGKTTGLQLNIPILNGFQTRTRVATAVVQQKVAELDAQNTRLLLRQAIEQAYNNMLIASKRFTAFQSQVNALSTALKAAEIRLNVGSANQVDYNLAKQNLSLAQSNLVQAKYDYLFRVKILDFYQNKPLTF